MYTNEAYSLDAEEYERVRNRLAQFQKETGTKDAIHVTLICGNGYRRSKFAGILQNVIQGEDLFAIRIIQAGNIRIFYVYGLENRVYAIHGYVKKTQEIPQREMAIARKALKWLIQKGLVS